MVASASLARLRVASSSTDLNRRALAIDEILRWTVRDELPKGYRTERLFNTGGSVLSMWRYAVLGTTIDCSAPEPGMPAALGDPHPDALRVEEAIKELGRALKAADAGTGPLPFDLVPYQIGAGLGPDCEVARATARAILGVVPWLITMAKRGGTPDCSQGPILRPGVNGTKSIAAWVTVEEIVGHGKDGQPWVVRTDRAAKLVQDSKPPRAYRYPDGAFCKLAWERSAADVAEDRAIYAAWHAALTWLAERLSGTETVETVDGPAERPILSLWKPRPPSAPMSPWLTPPTPPRVIHVVGAHGAAPVPAEPAEREGLVRCAPNPVRHIDPADWPLAA